MEPRWRGALAGFSEDELATAAAVLDSLRDAFDALADDGAEPDAAAPQAA